MAKRINVVLSQSPTVSPARQDLEERLIAELLLERGVDVTVIGHLAYLEPGDTGSLCLEGISGDMIVLSWLDPREASRILSSNQVTGRHGRALFQGGERDADSFAGSTDPPGEPARTIYHMDLRGHESAAPYCEEVRRIRDETSIQTFDIISAGANADVTPSVPPDGDGTESTESTESSGNRSLPDSSSIQPGTSLPDKSAPSEVDSRTPPGADVSRDGEEDEDAELDTLIDQLDQLDL